MRTADAMHEHHEQVLVELTEIGMVIARGLRDDVEAAETPEAKARAAAAYPRIARAVRQCLALETRFRRDAAREALEAEGRRQKEDALRLRRRKARVRMVVEQAICEETPDDETLDTRLTDLYERLHDDMLDEDFVLAPFPEVVASIHRQLGLSPPTFGDEAEDADEDPDDDDPEDEEAAFDAALPPESATPEPAPPEPPEPEPYFRYSSG